MERVNKVYTECEALKAEIREAFNDAFVLRTSFRLLVALRRETLLRPKSSFIGEVFRPRDPPPFARGIQLTLPHTAHTINSRRRLRAALA